MVVKGLREIGLDLDTPKATFYVWATVPKGYTSSDFCFKVLDDDERLDDPGVDVWEVWRRIFSYRPDASG